MDASDPQPDLLQNKPAPVALNELEALQYHIYKLKGQHDTLRNLFLGTLAALILLTLGLNLFIGKQMRMVRVQLTEFRPQVTRLVNEFQTKRDPAIRNFMTQLQGFAYSNQEFQPLLEKYRPMLGRYLAAPPALPLTQKPAAAPAPKPAQK